MAKNRDNLVQFLLDMRYRPARLEGLVEKYLVIDKNQLVATKQVLTDDGLECVKSLLNG